EPPSCDAAERFPTRPPPIALNAGSRRSVARDNFPLQLEVARQVRAAFPEARFVSPTVAVTHEIVSSAAAGLDWVTVKQDAFDELVAGGDACLCVSGAAALHTAAHGVPVVAGHAAPRL